MNKHDVKDWKNSPVTKAVMVNIEEAIVRCNEQSNIRDTADQTAIQTALSEGFISGVTSFLDAIADLDLIGDEDES